MPVVLIILLLATGFAACERRSATGARDEPASEQVEIAAVFDRRLVFIGSDEADSLAVIFDFATLDGSTILERYAFAWLSRGLNPEQFLALDWKTEPIREPWRLVPHGPLRLLVGDGEFETLLFRHEAGDLRLAIGEELSQWSVDQRSFFTLRRGELRVAGDMFQGILLDVQSSRRQDPAVPGDDEPATQPLGLAATYDEFVLTDWRDLFLIVSAIPQRADVWLRHPEERSWTNVSVEWLEEHAYEPARREIPARWWIETADGQLRGEIRAEAHDILLLDEGARPAIKGVLLATGWIEIDGERTRIFGVVRHGQR